MLQEVFYWLFNMSITAAITGMIIMLIRLVKRLPRRVTVFLWTIPFLRMVLPFGLNSPYSLMSLLTGITTKTVIVYHPTDDLAVSMMNSVMAADTYFPITYQVDFLENIFRVASVIWVIVSVAILLLLTVTYCTTVYEIRDSVHWKDNVFLSEKILSPAVFGIVKPKIILPTSEQDNELEFVLLHENAHIRSRDNLWRMICFVIVAVHWFNPFCWLFLKCFLTDLELACDERVLTKIGPHRAKEYALSLLEIKRGNTLFSSAFGGAKMRTRIENILSFQKLTWLSMAVFTALLGVIFYVLLTNGG